MTRMSSYSGLILKAVGSVCLFTALTPVKVTKHRAPNKSPELAGKSVVIGLYGRSCHERGLLQADAFSSSCELQLPSCSPSHVEGLFSQKHSESTDQNVKA